MWSTNRSLVYSAVGAAALTLTSCSENTAESASTPQVAAAAEHRFNVYFNVGRSGLTPEARHAIAQAIDDANHATRLKPRAVATPPHSKLPELRAQAKRAPP